MNDISNRRRLHQTLRQDRFENIVEDDERKRDQLGDSIYPRSQEEAVKTYQNYSPAYVDT